MRTRPFPSVAMDRPSSKSALADDESAPVERRVRDRGSGKRQVAPSAPADGKTSAIKRAAALRSKYRVPGPDAPPTALSPKLVAQHKLNRGGVAINGSRIDELLLQVLTHYDPEEANHGAVCVEEQPNCSYIREYNKEKTAGDAALAAVTDQAIPFGSLGASHINQVLRNIVYGARSEQAPHVVDESGKLSLERVGAHDSALADACTTGLKWDILSFRLEQEEPDGVSCIVAALNDRQAAQMLMHEMESIKTLARICTRESGVASDVAERQVRAKLVGQGFSALAESPGLSHLLRFVLEQGSDGALSIMQPLFIFHERFINPQLRRLRAHHFKDVCMIDCPWLRLVMLQSAYGASRRDGVKDCWIEAFGPPLVAKIMKPNMKSFRGDMSFMVKKFHRGYAALRAYAHFPAGHQHKFLGRLGMRLGDILMKAPEDQLKARAAMSVAVWGFEQDLRKDMDEEQSQKLGVPMGGPAQDPTPELPVAKKGNAPQEKRMMLVSYDEQGNALRTEGAALAAGSSRIEVLSLTATDRRQDAVREVAKAKLFEALHVCAQADNAVKSLAKAQAEGDPASLKTVRVFCKEEAAIGTLMFLPLVPFVQSITEESTHPHRVHCQVFDYGGDLTIAPCVKLMSRDAALAAARKGKEKDWVVPFWLMRRSSNRHECNCVIEHIQVDVILTGGGLCVPATDTTSARVVFDSHFKLPVITNDTAVAGDSELVLYHAAGAAPPRRGVPKKEVQPLKRARLTGAAASTEPETVLDSQSQAQSACVLRST